MKKQLLFSYATLCLMLTARAQWSGPTNGILSTSNKVHLNALSSSNQVPTPPTGYLFSVTVDNGFGTPAPSVRVTDNTGQVEIGKTLRLINGTGMLMTRSNNTNVFELTSIGSARLTTDGNNNQHRGFFINNGSLDFFSVTQQGLIYKDQSQDLFKVSTNGFAYARKMVVTLTNPFPDYVFESHYKLMPLNDLAAFIKEHKHLPNLPSAQQVADNDNQIELGEMQAKLLEKIEELTLYILQQQKQLDELNRKLAEKH